MATKITRDILESYLHCKFKGHLKATGQQGTKCDYETLLTERRAEVRLAAIEKILTRHVGEEIPRNIPLTTATLKQGASFLLDATLEDDLFSLTFDGLKKVEGASKLGEQGGMRWTLRGAKAMLNVRSVCASSEWKKFHQWRQAEGAKRLHQHQALVANYQGFAA